MAIGREDDLFLLPFDHFERYELTARVTRLLSARAGRQDWRVLDVGGAASSLKRFLPGASVVLADPAPPPAFAYRPQVPLSYDAYVRASGSRLPFADKSFDVVTAHDTLEHVAPDERRAFLEAVLRTARRLVVVNGPVYRPETRAAELQLAGFIREALGVEHGALAEHIGLGLPAPESIEAVFEEAGLPFACIPNGDLSAWLLMMLAKHHCQAVDPSGALEQSLDALFNRWHDGDAPRGLCYRHAYVVALDHEAEALLPDLPRQLDGARRPQGAPAAALEEFARRLAEASAAVRADRAALAQSRASRDAASDDGRRRREDLELQLALRDQRLRELESTIEALVHEKDTLLVDQHELLGQLNSIRAAPGYLLLEQLRRLQAKLAPPGSRRSALAGLATRGAGYLAVVGPRLFLTRLFQPWLWVGNMRRLDVPGPASGHISDPTLDDEYQVWLAKHALTDSRRRAIRRDIQRFTYRPSFSIVTPVYNTDPAYLREAIESVRGQLYEDWELCLADDGSTRPETLAALEEYAGRDPRIKLTRLPQNRGISAASNAALDLATGEFVGFVDHDDVLKPDALYHVAKLLNQQPDLDLVYSDEDRILPDGRLGQVFFKPDWSPDLLDCCNYVCHFTVCRRSLVEQVGRLRSQCDYAQDYDLVLRVSEATDRIAHIPLPLYSWRMTPKPAAVIEANDPASNAAAKLALREAAERRGYRARAVDGLIPAQFRLRYEIEGEPLVSIIIPTRDTTSIVKRCLNSVEEKTTYRNYELILVHHHVGENAEAAHAALGARRIIDYTGPFDFCAMNAAGAAAASGEYLVLLNDDTEVIAPEWLEAMLEHAQRREVGAVGARLFFPDGSVQHEGTVMGLRGGTAANVDHGGYFGLGEMVLDCSAVTAACMMTRRDVWDELGGLEPQLPVVYNDVDYCLRARAKGYRVVYTPYARLYHYEGATRGKLHPWDEELFFRKRWGNPGQLRDPYYNPNLDLMRPYRIATD